jgi:NAD+ synthase
MGFNKDILKIDCAAEADKLCTFIRQQVGSMKRDGAIIGLSGGVDSALCAILCAEALGKDRVLGIVLPEKENSPISEELANKHARAIGIETITEDISPALEGFGTYQKRNKVIREVFPEFTDEYKSKIVLPPDLLAKDALNYFTLKIMDPKGQVKSTRLTNNILRRIVAATNTKQVTRMMYLNYFADANNYLVCGTTNRTEYMQGFFVKFGDGGVDIEPIEHLYKMQVYQLAEYLNVIPEIVKRAPSPDTFSFTVTDEEMYFRIPYSTLDLLLYAWENKVPVAEVSRALALTEEQVKRAFRDLTSKYNTTNAVRLPPQSLNNAKIVRGNQEGRL